MREGSGRYRLLNEAYRKHGEDAFEVWILWKSDVALYSSLALRQHLRKREDFWIKELPATLNMRQRWDDPYFDVKRSTDFYMKRCEPVETFALFPPAYYAVRAPDGQEWVCRSMLEFCRWAEPICDVALNQSSMSRVARGEQKHHKGWTCGFINRAEYLSHFEDE
jgi:hypothetical protein